MSFVLTPTELDNAHAVICHHGYSALLPEPHEWPIVTEHWPELRSAIGALDLDTYKPYEPLRVFAPKNRGNIRITHLLHPQDLLIYTALTLIVKDDIEVNRIPVRAKRVFSYRSQLGNPNVLYRAAHAYDQYMTQLDRKHKKSSVRFVAGADIADFYPRVNQHRLENVLESVATTPRGRDVPRVLVKKLISNLMGRNSYGIPVGPYASRLLGEAVLIDVDAHLVSLGVDFVRWVDDYYFFCKTEYAAQRVLFSLGEWLYTKHGLTLQSAKTRVLTSEVFRQQVLRYGPHRSPDRKQIIARLKRFRTEYEEEDDEAPDEKEVDEFAAVLDGMDLAGIFEGAMSDTGTVDYEALIHVLKKLTALPAVSPVQKSNVLERIVSNADLLYPVAEHIAKFVISLDFLTAKDRRAVADQLLRPLRSRKNPPPPYYTMWILHIFSTSIEWNHAFDIAALYKSTNSDVIRRYAALASHTVGSRSDALAMREDYSGATPLVRLAILLASKHLGHDERRHWKSTASVAGNLEKLI